MNRREVCRHCRRPEGCGECEEERLRAAARHTVIMPPVETCGFMPLSRQVAALEGNRDAYKALAVQMYDTIRSNLDDGGLCTTGAIDPDRMERIVRQWKEVLDALAG